MNSFCFRTVPKVPRTVPSDFYSWTSHRISYNYELHYCIILGSKNAFLTKPFMVEIVLGNFVHLKDFKKIKLNPKLVCVGVVDSIISCYGCCYIFHIYIQKRWRVDSKSLSMVGKDTRHKRQKEKRSKIRPPSKKFNFYKIISVKYYVFLLITFITKY